MKFLCLLAVLAVAQADIDFDSVKPGWTSLPQFASYRKSGIIGKIVGGQEATPHQFPHQVAIFFTNPENTYFCGGSLISANYVLTAGHCVEQALNFTVYLGAHMVRDPVEEGRVIMNLDGKAAHRHPKYSQLLLHDDIALLKLSQPAPLDNPNIQILKLTNKDDSFAGETGTVSGWGKPSDDATSISPVLRWVQQPIITNLKCAEKFLLNIRATNICMSGDNGKSSCQGDSGGPLTVDTADGARQVGIVSFGSGLGCEKGWPAAFTRVSKYLDWIQQNSDVRIN